MNRRNRILGDGALIVFGVGLSTLMISTDGNGQNPLPVAGSMLSVAFVTCLVAFALGWFVRSVPLAVAATVVITDLLFGVYFVSRVAYRQQVHDHAAEEAFLLPVVFVVVTAPTVLLSAIGAGRFASRLFQAASKAPHDAESGAVPDGGSPGKPPSPS